MRTKRNLKALCIAFSAVAIGVACLSENAKAKINFITQDASLPGVVAKINGENITEDQLMGDARLELIQVRKQEYDLKISQLNKLVEEKLLGAEAKKEGLASVDEFISKKILKGEIKISDAEFKKFVKDRNIPEANINDQVKERINAYLKDQKKEELAQAYLAKLTKDSPVEVYFKKPKSNIQVDIGEAPLEGGENAKVTIVEFSDFQCPFCARSSKVLDEVHKKYGNKVKIAFKQFPLPMHNNAMGAAEASMCVYDQNKDKFWKFQSIAFSNQDKLDMDGLTQHAKAVGVDPTKFKTCMDAHQYSEWVKKDLVYGEKLGVRSTPTLFVNGQLLSGAPSIEVISEVIDEELSAKD